MTEHQHNILDRMATQIGHKLSPYPELDNSLVCADTPTHLQKRNETQSTT